MLFASPPGSRRRWITGFVVAAAIAGTPVASSAGPAQEAALPATARTTSFAVVELFTSQGCSSCPRADQALARLAAETDGDLAVFPIEWHVDYWDYLGWPDPYANPEAAQRQRRYSRALGTRVYTPQLVVNGSEVVRPAQDFARVYAAARAAIGASDSTTSSAPELVLASARHSNRSVQIDYQVTGMPAGCVLTVVAVERGLENFVPRGENAGRTLSHHNVVRGFATVDLGSAGGASGEVQITLPEGVHLDASSVIAYVQQQSTLQIVAAAAEAL